MYIRNFYGDGPQELGHALKHFCTLLHKFLHSSHQLSRNFHLNSFPQAIQRDTVGRFGQGTQHCNVWGDLTQQLVGDLVSVDPSDVPKRLVDIRSVVGIDTSVAPGRAPSALSMPSSFKLGSKSITQLGR